jgi:quinolinate synthase
MKRITLQGIADSLQYLRHEVTIQPALAERARQAVTRMLAVKS